MSIRLKFMVIVGVPILAIAVILLIGLLGFSNIRDVVKEMSALEDDRAVMLEADRDAYQANLAEVLATKTLDKNVVEAQKAASIENIQQAWDRMMGPAENFTEDMAADLKEFENEFSLWKGDSERIIQLALETVTGNARREELSIKAMDDFALMRDVIDRMGVFIESGLDGSVSLQRRRNLEQALSLVLNGDRDAYQAYVGEMLISRARTMEDLDAQEADIMENVNQVIDRVTQAADLYGSEALSLKNEFEDYFQGWYTGFAEMIRLSRENFQKNREIERLSVTSAEHFNTMRNAVDRLGNLQKERVDAQIVDMNSFMNRTTIVYLIIALVAIVLTILFVLVIASRIIGPLKKGVAFADEIAQGNLAVDLDIQQKDEIGNLAKSLENMIHVLRYKAEIVRRISEGDLTVDIEKASEKDGLGESLLVLKSSLTDIMSQIRTAADQVTSGADQVSQASQSLSQGATEQASSMEEISSSLNEINSQSKKNAENAVEANALAKQSAKGAEDGNQEMKQLTEAMEAIDASSDEIKKVVKVIDDIAFQINLLALNANVEAARAGKYGKGFAVVAEEVRNLAVRAASAVKETTAMVEDSITNIERGNASVESTAKQLNEIVTGIAKVATFLDEIAVASKEQALGIEQITEGLDQIEQVTQANTASAEESASASEELAGQALELQRLISQFKLEEREMLRLTAPE